MNHDSASSREGPKLAPNPQGQVPKLESIRNASGITTYTYSFADRLHDPVWVVEHYRETGTFHLTGPDGQTEQFGDRPLRFLVLEADPHAGELMPRICDGRPHILSLCRSVNGH